MLAQHADTVQQGAGFPECCVEAQHAVAPPLPPPHPQLAKSLVMLTHRVPHSSTAEGHRKHLLSTAGLESPQQQQHRTSSVRAEPTRSADPCWQCGAQDKSGASKRAQASERLTPAAAGHVAAHTGGAQRQESVALPAVEGRGGCVDAQPIAQGEPCRRRWSHRWLTHASIPTTAGLQAQA